MPHWGPLYVAGKTLELGAPGSTRNFEVLIPGTYSVESPHPVTIDGIERRPGSVLHLDAGAHSAAAVAPRRHQAVLRWAAALYRPEAPPSGQPVYRGF